MRFIEFLKYSDDISQSILGVLGGSDDFLSDEEKNHILNRSTNEFSSDIINRLISLGFVKSISDSDVNKYNDIVNSIKKGIPVRDLINKIQSTGFTEHLNIQNKHSWISPAGKFYPCYDKNHGDVAIQLTGLKYPECFERMFEQGWGRICFYGKDIYFNNPTIPPNNTQKQELISFAIENDMSRIYYDSNDGDKLIWSEDDRF